MNEDVHIDELFFSGTGTRTLAVTDNGDGTYTTAPFAACAPGGVTVTCTWASPGGAKVDTSTFNFQ